MAEIKKVYKNGTAYDVLNSDTVVDAVIPSQSGNSGKFLTTDGSDVSWATVDALPSQTSQSGKFLTTDGTTASWANVDALPTQTGQSGKFLTTNGTTASWATVEEGITKIFTLSSTSDLTTAQAAYDWWANGGNPIIKYDTTYYQLSIVTSSQMKFGQTFGYGAVSAGTQRGYFVDLKFTVSSGSVTAIEQTTNQIYIRSSAPTNYTNNIITLVI